MKFTEENQKERLEFIDRWSKYVLEHDDKTWSRQQNKIINSCLKTKMTKEQFLKMKG
jgi:type IV secretory pathway VirB4 component